VVHLPQKDEEDFVLFCQARGRLKKQKVAVLTGDRVELSEVNLLERTAVIVQQQERKTFIDRPPLANIDQVVIVQAVRQPDFSPLWMDRYLVHFQLSVPFTRPIICLNKCDLEDDNGLLRLRSIYEPLGYFVIFASATTGRGLQDLARVLSGKVSVFSGPSGVGKSSLLNKLSPGLDIKVGRMENAFGVGRHTTTYSELYRLNLEAFCQPASDMPEGAQAGLEDAQEGRFSWVADTPGFNVMDSMDCDPREVANEFPEILALGEFCKYADCLHMVESDCAVLAALESRSPGGDSDGEGDGDEDEDEVTTVGAEADSELNSGTQSDTDRDSELNSDIQSDTDRDSELNSGTQSDTDRDSEPDSSTGTDPDTESDSESVSDRLQPIVPSRYESYCLMVTEAQSMQEATKSISSKKESSVKSVGGEGGAKVKIIPRLAGRYRMASRKTERQRLPNSDEFDLANENDEPGESDPSEPYDHSDHSDNESALES
jgi:ribosome biogenesis GTPase